MSKGIDKKLDDAWSLLVKLVAGNKCEYCGKVSPLNSHHVYSRAKKSTRWHVSNGVCLCVGHHTFSSQFSAHLTPTEFTEWIVNTRGAEWYDKLRLVAHGESHFGKYEKEEMLKGLNESIEKLKNL